MEAPQSLGALLYNQSWPGNNKRQISATSPVHWRWAAVRPCSTNYLHGRCPTSLGQTASLFQHFAQARAAGSRQALLLTPRQSWPGGSIELLSICLLWRHMLVPLAKIRPGPNIDGQLNLYSGGWWGGGGVLLLVSTAGSEGNGH